MYDPATRRFTSEDPARDQLNWYAYCSNNPVMFIDPWGLDYDKLRTFVSEYGGTISETKYDDRGKAYVEISIPELDAWYGYYFDEHAEYIDEYGVSWMERTEFLDMMQIPYSVVVDEIYVDDAYVKNDSRLKSVLVNVTITAASAGIGGAFSIPSGVQTAASFGTGIISPFIFDIPAVKKGLYQDIYITVYKKNWNDGLNPAFTTRDSFVDGIRVEKKTYREL